MTDVAPVFIDDTVLVVGFQADDLPAIAIVAAPTDTVDASGSPPPEPAVIAPQPFTDTVVVDNASSTAAMVIVVADPTDTVVASTDYSPATPGNMASAGDLADLQAAVDGVTDNLADLEASIVALSNAAVDQAEAASAAAIAALQNAITANQDAVDTAQAAAINALSQLAAVATTILSIQSVIGDNTSSLTVQAAALTTLNESLSGQITAIQTAFDTNKASVIASLASLTTAQSALSTAQTDLASMVADNAATASQGLTTEVTARMALADTVTSLQSSYNQSVSSYNASISTLSDQESANAASLSTLSSSLGDTNATIVENAATAASATQAVAGTVTSFMATFLGQVASYNQTIAVLQSAEASTATQVTSLSASVAGAVGGGNDLANSELNGDDGWTNSTTVAGTNFGLNLGGYSAPGTVNVLYAAIPGTPGMNNVADWISPAMPTSPSARYEMSVLAAYHRAAYAQIFLEWIDASGAHISYSYEIAGGTAGGGSSLGGQDGVLANFTQIGCFAISPANAAACRLWLRTVTDGTESSPYGFFTHPFTRTASPGQTSLSPYSPGTQANVPAINAAITGNATAAANATSAVAAMVSTLTASYNQQIASYNQQFTALSDAQSSAATQIATLTASTQGSIAAITTAAAVTASAVGALQANYVLGVTAGSKAGFLSIVAVQKADGSASSGIELSADTIELHGDVIIDGSVGQGALTGAAVGNLQSAKRYAFFVNPGSAQWTSPADATIAKVSLWGGGEGCTGPNLVDGGGPGAYSEKVVSITPNTTYNLYVGAGGTPGQPGGVTAFSNVFSAPGGSNSQPGAATGGDFNPPGNPAGAGSTSSDDNGYSIFAGGPGGASWCGGTAYPGHNGNFPGGGAGGKTGTSEQYAAEQIPSGSGGLIVISF